MTEEPGPISTWTLRVLVYGGAVTGIGLVVAAATSDDPPSWWWAAGLPLAVICGGLASIWIGFRIKHRAPGARERALAQMAARKDSVGQPLARSRIAHQATKHKKTTLRSGVDGTAVVRFLADGHRANEFTHLVYLELEVTVAGGPPYQVETGEYLNPASAGSVSPGQVLHVKVNPADPTRVAVDWERSLRSE